MSSGWPLFETVSRLATTFNDVHPALHFGATETRYDLLRNRFTSYRLVCMYEMEDPILQ